SRVRCDLPARIRRPSSALPVRQLCDRSGTFQMSCSGKQAGLQPPPKPLILSELARSAYSGAPPDEPACPAVSGAAVSAGRAHKKPGSGGAPPEYAPTSAVAGRDERAWEGRRLH